jgi:hypothetical protein
MLTQNQLLELEGLMSWKYGFDTRLERMDLQTHPQVQAAKHVADLVFERDDPEHLLIVYYSGHGLASSNGRLFLHCNRHKDDDARETYIDWTDVEASLGKARADVLVILDCCYAGILKSERQPTRSSRRKFQYIAACQADQLTTSAGKDSFSRAMIEALDSLATKPGFTTRDLVRTLTAYEDFPRSDQEALVFDSRFGPVDEDIWIAALTEQSANIASQESKRQRENDLPTAAFLDLRFRFDRHATDSDVEATAEALKKLIGSTKDLKFHKISLLRRKSNVAAAVQHWSDVVDKKRGAGDAGRMTSKSWLTSDPEEHKAFKNAGLLG